MVPSGTPAAPNMIDDRANSQSSIGGKSTQVIVASTDKLSNSVTEKKEEHSSRETEPCESRPSLDDCSEMNKKNNMKNDTNKETAPTSHPTVRRVRANHRRNLSLDFRAMGIELPPLSEVVLPNNPTSPPRRLPNIPEHNTPAEITPQQPAITPKIKHVVRRILSRRIN